MKWLKYAVPAAPLAMTGRASFNRRKKVLCGTFCLGLLGATGSIATYPTKAEAFSHAIFEKIKKANQAATHKAQLLGYPHTGWKTKVIAHSVGAYRAELETTFSIGARLDTASITIECIGLSTNKRLPLRVWTTTNGRNKDVVLPRWKHTYVHSLSFRGASIGRSVLKVGCLGNEDKVVHYRVAY